MIEVTLSIPFFLATIDFSRSRLRLIEEAMSRINVISGDFLAGDAEFQSGLFTLKSVLKPSLKLTIPISNIKELETASEEVVKNQASVIRWSLAGVLLLGPIGLVAGWLLCDKEREVTFFAMFKDGRYFLAKTDIDTYSKISQSPQVTRDFDAKAGFIPVIQCRRSIVRAHILSGKGSLS